MGENEHKESQFVRQQSAIAMAQREAAEVRRMYDALSPFERGLAHKQIAVIERLVRAVEAL